LRSEQPRAINNNPIAAAAVNAKTIFELNLFASRIARRSSARRIPIRRALTITSLAVFLNSGEKFLAITVIWKAGLRALVTYPSDHLHDFGFTRRVVAKPSRRPACRQARFKKGPGGERAAYRIVSLKTRQRFLQAGRVVFSSPEPVPSVCVFVKMPDRQIDAGSGHNGHKKNQTDNDSDEGFPSLSHLFVLKPALSLL